MKSSVFVRSQESVAVEVDHVVGKVGNPDFGLPDDGGRVLFEVGEAQKRCDVHTIRGAVA